MAKSKYDPTGAEIDTSTPSTGSSGYQVPSYLADDTGNAPAHGPTPKKYIGVASPTWQQAADGTWSLEGGYSRVLGTPDMGIVATPGYYEGDEYQIIAGMGASPETIAAIQAKMAEAGLMPENYLVGRWESYTQDAFKQVLAYANITTQDWQHALDDLLQGGGIPKAAGPKGPVFTAHLTNSDDVKKAFKDVSYQLLGGQFVDPGQADAFVETFHAQELGAQRAAFNAATGGGGTVEDAPNIGTAAETTLEQTTPEGLKAKRYNDLANVFGSIIGQKAPAT